MKNYRNLMTVFYSIAIAGLIATPILFIWGWQWGAIRSGLTALYLFTVLFVLRKWVA